MMDKPKIFDVSMSERQIPSFRGIQARTTKSIMGVAKSPGARRFAHAHIVTKRLRTNKQWH